MSIRNHIERARFAQQVNEQVHDVQLEIKPGLFFDPNHPVDDPVTWASAAEYRRAWHARIDEAWFGVIDCLYASAFGEDCRYDPREMIADAREVI